MENKAVDGVSISVMEDGPLIVTGLSELLTPKGEALPVKTKIALCRCGASAKKPFCDGAHVGAGFSGARETDKPLDKTRAYAGEKITIHDNRVVCSHAAECVEHLSPVFKLGARPWIDPDAASAQEIIDLVERCPSGALSYSMDGVAGSDPGRSPAVRIAEDGPYNVEGSIELLVGEELQPVNKQRYALCRCGVSKNKPYCDGSHYEAEFSDAAEKRWTK